MKKPIHATGPKIASMKFVRLLFLAVALAACSSRAPYSTTVGELGPNRTMTITAASAPIEIYRPASGEPAQRYTVSATVLSSASPPPPPAIHTAGNGIVVSAMNPLDRLLVRVPDGANVVVDNAAGDVGVTGITGNADVTTKRGDVRIMISGYAQAATGGGHLSVTFGAAQWPGVLHFADADGDVEIYVVETAKFHVHLRTGNGTLFSDFGLRGSAAGTAETIDASVNGGGPQGIDVEVGRGTIRLLRLAPQA